MVVALQRLEHAYPALSREIEDLREFAEPLQQEVTVTPLMPIIARIMSLPDELDLWEANAEDIRHIEEEVRECKRQLAEISYEYVSQIITKPDPSKVFKILAKATRFEKELRKASGKIIKMPDGSEVKITPEFIECLTRYRFSLGTPPVTPKGIETIEKLLFGSNLQNIYAFRDVLPVDKGVFDRFLGAVDRLVEQSTHYTTATEKDDYESQAKDFTNLEGLRGMTKTTVTGTAKTAVRLIKEHLLSKHANGTMPLKVIEEPDRLNSTLIKEMTQSQESIFVVRVTAVPHHVFTSDVLKSKWKGVIGRLVIIDDSENARRSGTTMVYSLHPRITKALAQFHVKDSGTPANTQMNLRLILENFKNADLENLEKSVDTKILQFEAEGVRNFDITDVRKREWKISAQKDYLSLKKFKRFLEFIKFLKNGKPAEIEEYCKELTEVVGSQSAQYFFKGLVAKGYQCVAVPQGGGRRELKHPGNFHLQKLDRKVASFKGTKLAELKARLGRLKAEQLGNLQSSPAESTALGLALQQRRSPNAAVRDGGESGIMDFVRTAATEALYIGGSHAEKAIDHAIEHLDEILGRNLPGILKAGVVKILKGQGIESAAKMLERGRFHEAANRLRAFEGRIRRTAVGVADAVRAPLESVRGKLEPSALDEVEKMIHDIEHGSFQPSLALAEISWTIDDILIEDDFPGKNFVRISLEQNGQLDPYSLEDQLEEKRKSLKDFPELFELYCESILLYVNDPHNPTSQVATPEVKLKLFDIASRYGISILADEPYHKQVAKEIKDRDGDVPLAEFYEQHKSRFPNSVTIYTALSTTKWAMGAGRRTGVLLTNDASTDAEGRTFGEFVEANTDGVNTMALRMDHETLATGLLVKRVCKELEPAIIYKNPIKAIDTLLRENFSDLDAESFNIPVYMALLEARNDLEKLKIRGATPLDTRKYLSDFIRELKGLRLDKQTQRDSAKRSKAAIKAVENLSQEFPGLEERCIKPKGPFYFCVKLDETGKDMGLQPFLEAIARARKIDVVPLAKGYVRFAFGGILDGNDESYELLTLAIETDLRLLLQYWEKFKEARAGLNASKDLDPEFNALKQLFPGGEAEIAMTLGDKATLIEKLQKSKKGGRKRLTFPFSATASKYISSVEPNSRTNIVLIRGVKCNTVQEFIKSEGFCELFNYYLLKAKKSISLLEQMSDQKVLAECGARRFAEKFATRDFTDVRKEVFEEIAIKVANLWFSAGNIKILGLELPEGTDKSVQADALMGAQHRISEFIKEFLKPFVSGEKEKEINYQPTFQAGYQARKGVKADKTLPLWQRRVIENVEFAGQTIPTDPSPSMDTPGATRVAGFDRGIFRRDGDGQDAPTPEFFRKRLAEFAEVMNPKDYICKMVQVGPTRLMLVMHKSYSHYLVEELRLLPQFDASLDDLNSLKPDAVSFLGIPTKVMGSEYRIGYFLDQKVIPVSWVDAEDITNYMGYLKKPLLTMGNERVKAIGGLPVHGSAFTIEAKNGLRKTVVLAGDSGTGKSETIIAMVEQIIQGMGGAREIKSVELLCGDMLSLFTGEDSQIYMIGTESGDFMRLTDISENWTKQFRDLLHKASKTNLTHATNPRATIPGLCDQHKFLRPVRVNMFLTINNFEKPAGTAFQEEPDPKNLLLNTYVRGYRCEKGTSGDQPNIYASIFYSQSPRKRELLRKYREEFDELLGWNNATLAFDDVPGKVFKARRMIHDLFVGEMVKVGERKCLIEKINHNVHENRFYAKLKAEDGETLEVPLDRSIFDQIYNPIASTYCGNPFIDPRGMDDILERFAQAMRGGATKSNAVITGTLYTQLAVPGEQFSGPARASQALIDFIQTDQRINERFQNNKKRVLENLKRKYGTAIFGQEALPQQLEAYNLRLLERHESETTRLVDKDSNVIPIKTPYWENDKKDAMDDEFKSSLITPEIETAIQDIITNADSCNINLDDFTPVLGQYHCIKKVVNSKVELIYQILLVNGIMRLGDEAKLTDLWTHEVKKAEKIADKMIKKGMIEIPAVKKIKMAA